MLLRQSIAVVYTSYKVWTTAESQERTPTENTDFQSSEAAMSVEVHGVGSDGVDAMETMMDERLDMQCRQELDCVGRMNKARCYTPSSSHHNVVYWRIVYNNNNTE